MLFYSWVPFVAAADLRACWTNLDTRLLEAAQDLGASRFATFLRVTLPLSLPGVIAGFVFVLIPTTGEFITPLLVGGPSSQMFGNSIQSFFRTRRTGTTGRCWRLAGRGGGRDAARVRPLPGHRPAGDDRGERRPPAGSARRLLASYFGLLVVFLYVPLVVLVVFAFNDSHDPDAAAVGFTTQWFHAAFANTDLTGALKRSAWIGAHQRRRRDGARARWRRSALAGRRLRLRSVWTTLLLLPLVVPYIVLAVGMVIVHARSSATRRRWRPCWPGTS